MKTRSILAAVAIALCSAPLARSIEVMSMEYFLDTDPGVGNGIPLTFSVAGTVAVDAIVPLDGVAPGLHTLYVRAIDSDGNPSLLGSRIFSVQIDPAAAIQVTQLVYSVDSDAQPGAVTPLAITAGPFVEIQQQIPLGGMDEGPGVLTVRAVDDQGRTGIPASRAIVKTTSILEPAPFLDHLRYWIVPDAGGAPLIDQTVPIGDQATVDHGVVETLAGLVRGETYRVLIQAADETGAMSATVQDEFRFVCLEDLWAERYFTEAQRQDPAISGLDADPNSNGVPNRVEIALAHDPLAPGLPLAPIEEDNLFHLQGQSWQGGIGTPLVDYTVNGYHVHTEVTTDLVNQEWSDAADVLEVTTQPSQTDPLTDDVEVRLTEEAAAGSEQYFFRLVVAWPEFCSPFAYFED